LKTPLAHAFVGRPSRIDVLFQLCHQFTGSVQLLTFDINCESAQESLDISQKVLRNYQFTPAGLAALSIPSG